MVTLRPYKRGGWEVDLRVVLPDGSEHRQRRRAPVSSKSAAQRWGEDRERHWYHELTHPEPAANQKEVPTLESFASRFLDGHARANRQKASGIASKESILRNHLIPQLGLKKLDEITTEDVQHLKGDLVGRTNKTTNNVLTTLNTLLKKVVEWDVIKHMPCTIRLLPISKPSVGFFDFEEYERLAEAAQKLDAMAYLVVLLGGDAGLRCGEIIALEWTDIDLRKRQLCVQRADWHGHVSTTKSGRLRYVPMTARLAAALRDHRHLRARRVVCQRDGSALTQDLVRDHVQRAARRAQLATSGVHRLRHTFCSHLAMRGAPARAIQELAGHQDLSTTQRYMHLSPAAIEGAIRLLEQPRPTGNFGDIVETGDHEMANSQSG
ncbi:MAG TPA: tyrosine-type recombinase/integrase [Vicinamibacterales bacterium]|nr:tyrosine-type recombinase/integrase [Vicinamibacterales bacterium]